MATDDGAHYRHQHEAAETEAERQERRRMEAGTAFELNRPPIKRSRLDSFHQGHGAYRVEEW